ncbi:MAG: hypothetical protein KF726_28015 [Anaerolineae bacterium]|nr:hypothetical protein [Anaerolineae bacterium]
MDNTSDGSTVTIVQGSTKTKAGITSYWRSDGIFVIKVADATRPTADVLRDTLINFDQEGWEQQRHNLSLVDIRGIFPTPYATQRVMEASDKTPPDLRESQAILVDRTALFQLVRMLIGKLTPKSREVTHIFFAEAEAIHWLYQRRDALGA